MSCQLSFYKVLLSIVNTVLSLLGIGLIALSVYELNSSTPGTFEHVAVVVQIFIGSFIILTSFTGCIGTCRHSLSLVWSYVMCVGFLLAFQLYIIVAAHSTDYVLNARNDFNNLWSNYTLNEDRISSIETSNHCCGRNNSLDYEHIVGAIPKKCYLNQERTLENLFKDGCLEVLEENASKNSQIGLTVKWIIFFLELCALGLASLLGINLRNKRRRKQFEN
ncbi:protein late bloomer [Musca domestica]|uniref:Protein late bloomer n=1 Tax=Musca domestica TaxID=7370 RepID=A0A9J7CNR3_MUSDO|nr:protein late bloomer [Musca domestica]